MDLLQHNRKQEFGSFISKLGFHSKCPKAFFYNHKVPSRGTKQFPERLSLWFSLSVKPSGEVSGLNLWPV